ncbi:hypothetical protein JXO59_07080 [candidate division KSB1 bacterium]|nr:hypothetical protein [candidate division KSB1 bacterium]
MSQNFHSLIPELKKRLKEECLREITQDTNELLGLPNPYIIPGKGKVEALHYWDTHFINLGLLRMRMVDYARHNVENLVYLVRQLGYVPASNHRDMLSHSHPPFLPWMVRDIYRATGDKEWLRRVLPQVVQEFRFWTNKPHTSLTGLYRYHPIKEDSKWPPERAAQAESGWLDSPRFEDPRTINAVDLNTLLWRNAKLIYDLQVEADGIGDEILMQKVTYQKKLMDYCWNEQEGFYFDNDFEQKKLSTVKSLAGFMPLFAEMVDEDRAERMHGHLHAFSADGGLMCTVPEQSKAKSVWSAPICQAPYLYTTLKGLCDYELMEDAADIGTSWLNMVVDIYEKTGELWSWYNVNDCSTTHPDSIENTPTLGWTAGVYIEIVETLGLD